MPATPIFPWESLQVPNDDFWNSLPYAAGRNFLQCYTQKELEQMHFDISLSDREKQQNLLAQLQETLSLKDAAAAPKTLLDCDLPGWQHLMLGIATMEKLLGNIDGEEKILRTMVDNSPKGNLSALFNLSSVVESRGEYPEAEEMAREVLPWMQSHELLGNDSPQALKCKRILIQAIWKQGRYSEARKLIEELSGTVTAMEGGKFAKYQADEKKNLAAMEKELGEWIKQE